MSGRADGADLVGSGVPFFGWGAAGTGVRVTSGGAGRVSGVSRFRRAPLAVGRALLRHTGPTAFASLVPVLSCTAQEP